MLQNGAPPESGARYSDDDGMAGEVQKTSDALHAAESAYARVRWRVMVSALLIAATITSTFLAMWLCAEYGVVPLTTAQRELTKTVCAVGSLAGIPVAGIAALPSDERGVRAINQFVACSTFALGCVFSLVAASSLWRGISSGADLIELWLCGTHSCIGFVLNSRYLEVTTAAMPPRRAFEFAWSMGHDAGRMLSAVWLAYALAVFVVDRSFTPERAACCLALWLVPRIYVWLTPPATVVALQSWLQRLGRGRRRRGALQMADHAMEDLEAGVGALLGQRTAQEALDHGQANFRAIAFSQLDETVFLSLEHARSLFGRSHLAQIGQCDAFVSHSWKDPAAIKWAVLHQWAAAFRRRHGREPVLWIDGCCVDQVDDRIPADGTLTNP